MKSPQRRLEGSSRLGGLNVWPVNNFPKQDNQTKMPANTLSLPTKQPRIRDWPAGDRPRDKFREDGRYLSNAELLTLSIGPGNARYNSVELARAVLATAHDRLSELSKKSIPELMRIPGIGLAKACAIQAFAELSRRRQSEEGLEKIQLKDSPNAAAFIRPLLKDMDQ